MEDELAVLIAMCCVFFTIAATALVLYLKGEDQIRRRGDEVGEYRVLQQEWEAERAELLKHRREHEASLAKAAMGGLGGGGSIGTSKVLQKMDSAPPLPLQEQVEGVPSSGPGSQHRALRKDVARRALALHIAASWKTPLRLWYGKWLRWAVMVKVAGERAGQSIAGAYHHAPLHAVANVGNGGLGMKGGGVGSGVGSNVAAPAGSVSQGVVARRQPAAVVANGANNNGNGNNNTRVNTKVVLYDLPHHGAGAAGGASAPLAVPHWDPSAVAAAAAPPTMLPPRIEPPQHALLLQAQPQVPLSHFDLRAFDPPAATAPRSPPLLARPPPPAASQQQQQQQLNPRCISPERNRSPERSLPPTQAEAYYQEGLLTFGAHYPATGRTGKPYGRRV